MKQNTFKRIFSLVMVFALALSMLAGCAAKEAPKAEGNAAASAKSEPLKVGILPFTGSVPVAYADEKGYFEDAGLNIELYSFPTGAPMNEAFAAGQLDIAIIGLAGVISMSKGNAVCIYETNTASGGNGIFVRSDSPVAAVQGEVEAIPELYGSVETLKGVTVIGNLGTSSQLQTIMYLDQFGLTLDDVNFVNMDTGADLQAFKAGEGDMVSLMTPFTYDAMDDENFVLVGSFDQVADYMIPDTMLATKDAVANNREAVKSFLEVYLKTVDELNADEELLFNTSKQYFIDCGREYADDYLREDIACRFLIGTEYMKSEGYVYGKGMWEVGKLFVESGKIEAENLHNVADCLDTSFIKELTGFEPAVQVAE